MSDVVYAIEPLNQWRRDADHLLHGHWQELSSYPDVLPEPDWSWYDRMEADGGLVIYTARIDGELVGYMSFIGMKPHPHYKSIRWAFNDILRISPDHRRRGIGRGLFDYAEADLKRRGVDYAQIRTKTGHPELARMLEARGYTADEVDYLRRL
jgi:GNAT superfamily N-acetyltransferase